MPRIARPSPVRDNFRWRSSVKVDPSYAELQHVGNMELARLFNAARVEFSRHVASQMMGTEYFLNQVIVHICMDFLLEISWEREIHVFIRVGRIGGSSYDLELAIFRQDAIAAICTTTSVWMKQGKPRRLNREAKALLSTFV